MFESPFTCIDLWKPRTDLSLQVHEICAKFHKPSNLAPTQTSRNDLRFKRKHSILHTAIYRLEKTLCIIIVCKGKT